MAGPGNARFLPSEDLVAIPRNHSRSEKAAEVHSITTAAGSHTQDMTHRMKVYGFQMGLRILCIIGFVAVDNLWARIFFVTGAALFPWFAVMLANQGADRSERTSSYYRPPMRTELPTTAQTTASQSKDAQEPIVVDGEFHVRPQQPQLPPAPRHTMSRRN